MMEKVKIGNTVSAKAFVPFFENMDMASSHVYSIPKWGLHRLNDASIMGRFTKPHTIRYQDIKVFKKRAR